MSLSVCPWGEEEGVGRSPAPQIQSAHIPDSPVWLYIVICALSAPDL